LIWGRKINQEGKQRTCPLLYSNSILKILLTTPALLVIEAFYLTMFPW
jgi:hypothetical protein